MTEFTTPKGTKLPLMNLKGKDYLAVAQRVRWFREEHLLGRIQTERISESDKHVTYRATVSIPIPNAQTLYSALSNADKTLELKSTLDYEKCETGAIGRALALAGYGTAFAVDDLDEGDVVDAPIEKGKHGTSGVSKTVAREHLSQPGEASPGHSSFGQAYNDSTGFYPDEPLPFENEENPVPKEIREKEFHPVPKPNGKTYFLDQEVDGEDKVTAGKHTGKTYHELMLDDEKNDFKYARWIMRLLHAEENVGLYLKKYVTYIKQEGRGGTWL